MLAVMRAFENVRHPPSKAFEIEPAVPRDEAEDAVQARQSLKRIAHFSTCASASSAVMESTVASNCSWTSSDKSS